MQTSNGGAVRRLPYLLALILSLVLLREALRLPAWDIFGAGPGLFPTVVAGIVAMVAAALTLFPGLAGDAPAPELEGAPENAPGRVFWMTALALPLMAFATVWTGFIVLATGLSLLMVWLAERRSPFAALAFGLACGLVAVIGFELVLRVNIPSDWIDRALLRNLR